MPDAKDIIVSVYAKDQVPITPFSGAVSFRVDGGDSVMEEKLSDPQHVTARPLITSVLVVPRRPTHAIVAFGDSISDGNRLAPSKPHGWVAELSARIASDGKNPSFSVVSAGIGGNRVLHGSWGPSALARADRDVFAVPGIRGIILLEGINDIGMSGKTFLGVEPTVDVHALIAGYQQIAARSHVHGINIFIGTLTPFEGATYYSAEKEQAREQVNAWIRASEDFDGIVDFDQLMRDTAKPTHLKAEFDSGDHLHPSLAGYKAMADSIDLTKFM